MLSAGIALYRRGPGGVEILLLHHGGPFWARKDEGAWTIPKGLCEPGEEPEEAARREFREETGQAVPDGALVELGEVRLSAGKVLLAFALEGEFDATALASNTFEMEWPPNSGRRQLFPEADRAGWFGPEAALEKLAKGQRPIVAALLAAI